MEKGRPGGLGLKHVLAGAREEASMGARRFIPRNHRAGYKYLLRASLPLFFDALLLFTSNPLPLLLFLSFFLSPLLLQLFLSCITEASQKGRWKEGRGPREEGRGPWDSRVPMACELLGSWCGVVPGTCNGQELCPCIPPARGTAAPEQGAPLLCASCSPQTGLILKAEGVEKPSRAFSTFSLVHPRVFLLHFHPAFGQTSSSTGMNQPCLTAARYRALPAPGQAGSPCHP